jgi:hypothetical protein
MVVIWGESKIVLKEHIGVVYGKRVKQRDGGVRPGQREIEHWPKDGHKGTMGVPGVEEFCTTLWIQNVREDSQLGWGGWEASWDIFDPGPRRSSESALNLSLCTLQEMSEGQGYFPKEWGTKKVLEQWLSTCVVGCNPSGSQTTLSQGSHIRYPAYQMFYMTVHNNIKITVMKLK